MGLILTSKPARTRSSPRFGHAGRRSEARPGAGRQPSGRRSTRRRSEGACRAETQRRALRCLTVAVLAASLVAALGACAGTFGPGMAALRQVSPVPLDSGTFARDIRTVGRTLRSMTLEQKIGERFVVWVKGVELTDQTRRLIETGSPAGIILYPWNATDREQVRGFTTELQRLACARTPAVGLFIAVDQEGGRVAAFRFPEMARFPAAHYWGRTADPGYVMSAAYVTARELRALGCTMNFAPVLDLYPAADSTIIGDRSLGADPARVAELGIAYLKGSRLGGVIPVIKHFPGHGSSTVDSHGSLPVVDLPEEVLRERDFFPFVQAIDHGAEALMTAHVLFPSIDPEYPVTLSRVFLHDLLRRELGFRGVVISDGMSMGALSRNFTVRDSLLLQLQGGVDLILVHATYDLEQLEAEVMSLVREGRIREKDINAGVRRVLRLKLRYGLLPPFPSLPAGVAPPVPAERALPPHGPPR
jgi:beta-N-acetylhexosaminidase